MFKEIAKALFNIFLYSNYNKKTIIVQVEKGEIYHEI